VKSLFFPSFSKEAKVTNFFIYKLDVLNWQVSKVRDAAAASAMAVIIADNVDEGSLISMADDGTGSSINIPSVFISNKDGLVLKALLQKNPVVQVQLTWKDFKKSLSWEYYMTANDDSRPFKRDFAAVSNKLSLSGKVTFNPHYMFIDGIYYGCTMPKQPCGSQCTNMGRYCAVDPERDLDQGKTGAMVVEENLRQYCIFQQANATVATLPKWWAYTEYFYAECDAKFKDSASWLSCSKAQQTRAGLDTAVTDKCLADCGTLDAALDVANKCIDAEVNKQMDNGVSKLPTLSIDGDQYRGALDCSTPVSMATCDFLTQLCSRFASDSRPDVCDPSYCWNGLDECGVCKDGKDPSQTNQCFDCQQPPVKNGGWTFDDCGQCLSPSDPGRGTFDVCGRCLKPDDASRATDKDKCNSAPSSSSYVVSIVVTCVVLFLAGGGAGYIYLQRAEKKMRDQMGDYLSKYVPIDAANDFIAAGNANTAAGGTTTSGNQWKKLPIS
jgi:hypothetical protein